MLNLECTASTSSTSSVKMAPAPEKAACRGEGCVSTFGTMNASSMAARSRHERREADVPIRLEHHAKTKMLDILWKSREGASVSVTTTETTLFSAMTDLLAGCVVTAYEFSGNEGLGDPSPALGRVR